MLRLSHVLAQKGVFVRPSQDVTIGCLSPSQISNSSDSPLLAVVFLLHQRRSGLQSFSSSHGKYVCVCIRLAGPSSQVLSQLRKCFRQAHNGPSVANRKSKRPRKIRSQDEGPSLERAIAVDFHRLLRFSFCLCNAGFEVRRHLVRFCDLFRRTSLAMSDHPDYVRVGCCAALDRSGLFSRSPDCTTIFPFQGRGTANDIIWNCQTACLEARPLLTESSIDSVVFFPVWGSHRHVRAEK